MDIHLIADNLLAGPILFFLFGFVAVTLKSDLEVPQPLPKFLSLYLVIAIGLKGGVELNHGDLELACLKVFVATIALSLIVPAVAFRFLKNRLGVYNAAAVAATYGSVSVVTFITAVSAAEGSGLVYHGYMVAAMALMEAPPIVMAVGLVRRHCPDLQAELEGDSTGVVPERFSWSKILHESLLHGPIVLLLGCLVIGRLMSHKSADVVMPFFTMLFPGVLCVYLFDMGLNAARRLTMLNSFDRYLLGFAVIVPLINAAIGIGVSYLLGVDRGDALLLCVLCASASYVAVPAAMQLAVPKSDPSIYLTMSLGLTFPFNIAIGIPLYLTVIKMVL